MAVCVGRQRLRYQLTTALSGGLRMTACCVQLIFKTMRLKVVFILKNGQKFIVKCKSFSMSKLSQNKDNRTLRIDKADRIWSVDLDEIVAVSAKRCLF